jgi:VanZ family protein
VHSRFSKTFYYRFQKNRPNLLACIWVLVFLLLPLDKAQAQRLPADPDSLSAREKRARLIGLGAAFGLGYTGGMVLLHQAWYKHDPRSSFHFHDDSRYWKQMDKAGHFWGAFQQSRAGVDMLKWAGASDKKAIWYGGLLGVVLQTPIEIFDGYGSEYGASVSDMLANKAGSAAVIAQHLAWGEIRLMPKFSFSRSPYAPLRLTMLGDNYLEQVLKDYNGQTYWLSADVSAFLPADSRYPRWLNVAVGYGADGMVYGDPVANRQYGHDAHRQYFLSLDLNLMNIPTRSKFLKKVFYVASIFRIPAPAIEFNRKQKLVFHPLYF